MADNYSPIDETSYTDGSYDPATMLADPPAPSVPETRTETVGTTTPPAPEAPRVKTPDHSAGAAVATKATRMVKDSRTLMFIGLVLVVLAGYALIVTISYFANIGSDQSAMLSGDFDPALIKNAGGPVGAWLAHTLLYNWVGLGAFFLIYYAAVSGLILLRQVRTSFWDLSLRCLLSALAVSVVGGFITSLFASPIYWGGRHGHLLNERLTELAGIWGSLGISVILVGMVALLYLAHIRKGWRYVSAAIASYRTRQAERRAIREAQEAEQRAAREAQEAEQRAIREAQEAEQRAIREAKEAEQRAIREAQEAERERERAAAAAQAAAQKAEETQPAPAQPQPTPSEPQASLFSAPEEEQDPSTAKDEEEESYAPLMMTDDVDDSDHDPMALFHDEEEEEPIPQPSVESEAAGEEPLFADRAPRTESSVADQPPYDPRAELSHFRFPSIDLLREAKNSGTSVDEQEMEENKVRITETLNHYGIPISQIEATVGPTVTLYEIIPAEGVRIAKIKRLEDDIALSLAALGIRIIAPIPGKGTIGIEVPNKDPQIVSMRSVIESRAYTESRMELPMAMGCTISNEVFIADLCKMPHLLVAGATGMGKSVGLNAIITSLLYKKHPSELKFVLVDPKMVEFSLYAKLERHYLAKLPDEEDAIITDPSKVVATLNSLCVEMDNRYALLKDASMRNIKEYNDKFVNHHLNPEKGHRYLPYIVVIVDEFADLIMTAGKEVETPIARIAQKARAVGIHMILATQRPSTNVITGVIKANFPGRVAFRVFQMVDSRTIIDRPGANQLIGRGDMLFSNNGKLDRVQCAFIDTPEVSAICDSIDEQIGFDCAYELPEYVADTDAAGDLSNLGDRDPLFEECARLVVTTDTASTSSLQRRYSIGYNRAGKIMDQMEAAGIVGPSQGGKPRQVLIDPVTLERILENS